MAGFTRKGRFSVSSIQLARKLAAHLDTSIHQASGAITFPSVTSLFSGLRAYLQKQNDRLGAKNDVFSILKWTDAGTVTLFTLGPTIDKGNTAGHFHFPSGSRLSFGVTIKRQGTCSLVAYRFHFQRPGKSSPDFVRFDLNPERHKDPLLEPRCHVHPGIENVRLPLPALTPFQVLDRIFFVLESA